MRFSKAILIFAAAISSATGIARAQNATLNLASTPPAPPADLSGTASAATNAAVVSRPAKERSLLRRIASYPLEHKSEFAMGTGLMLARMADAATTVHGIHTGTAFEADGFTRFLIGRRPSNFGVYSLSAGMGLAVIGVNHLWMNRWFKGSDPWEFAPAFWTVPQIVMGATTAQCNIAGLAGSPGPGAGGSTARPAPLQIYAPALFHRESLSR
ncbi:MAG TPA: hypothetical protein VEG64_05145 [Candidatus Sulfotelmatobacter sp.]|nr:hypothetical protein [Candidatus Sulfotelmatobacter sp.]